MAGMFNNFSKFFGMTEDDYQDDNYEETTPKPVAESPRVDNVVSMQAGATKANKIVLFEPRIYSDAKEVGKHLLQNKAVIVNFNRIDATQATRVVDFLTGAVYAIHGEIQRVGDQIFLCTPPNFEIDGSLTDLVDSSDFNTGVN